jgi:hypothetical protein
MADQGTGQCLHWCDRPSCSAKVDITTDRPALRRPPELWKWAISMNNEAAPLAGLRVLGLCAHAALPLAPWFARRTAAGLAAAFAGTSVSAERQPGFGPCPASPPGRLAAVGDWP